LRLLRQHTGDIGLVIRLNAQYSSMVRTSLSVHARLMRVQAVRHKREASDSAANQDTWTQHIAERSMLGVVDPDAVTQQAASPGAAPPAWPGEAPATWPAGVHPAWLDWAPPAPPENTPPASLENTAPASPEGAPAASLENTHPASLGATPVEAPPACGDQRTAGNVSENGTNSQKTPFETYLSALPWKEMSTGSGKTGPLDVIHQVLARSRSAARESPANGRETPGRAPRARSFEVDFNLKPESPS
jgi:hypothetical protein